jgi:prolyl 4-hydroxylase
VFLGRSWAPTKLFTSLNIFRPLEVYGHDGKATNVTMLPGDMVLYESHSVIHGRPFPMKGNFYANVFVHFEPIEAYPGVDASLNAAKDIPPYIIPGSPWEEEWKKSNQGWAAVGKLSDTN